MTTEVTLVMAPLQPRICTGVDSGKKRGGLIIHLLDVMTTEVALKIVVNLF